MMEQTNTCPICGQTFSSALCPRCGFENRLMLVSEPNSIIQQIDEQRIEIAKRNWGFAIKLQEEIESLTNENQNVQSQITELNQTIAERDSQIKELSTVDDENKRLRQDLIEKQQKMDAVTVERDKLLNEKSQLNKKQKELEDRIKELSDKLSGETQLKKEKEEWKTKYDELFKKMSEAQLEIDRLKTELKSNSNSVLLGIVSLKNKVTNVLSYLPVYKGENTYGSMADDGKNHHQIKMRVRGEVLKPKMFSVQINNNAAIVYPIGDINIVCDGSPIPVKGKIVMAQQSLFVDDIIEIHVSKI